MGIYLIPRSGLEPYARGKASPLCAKVSIPLHLLSTNQRDGLRNAAQWCGLEVSISPIGERPYLSAIARSGSKYHAAVGLSVSMSIGQGIPCPSRRCLEENERSHSIHRVNMHERDCLHHVVARIYYRKDQLTALPTPSYPVAPSFSNEQPESLYAGTKSRPDKTWHSRCCRSLTCARTHDTIPRRSMPINRPGERQWCILTGVRYMRYHLP